MNEMVLATLSALWLGVLTSISPCPLATNIAAISYVGRRLDRPSLVLAGGILYTLGRALTYGVLGSLLVASLLEAPILSQLLQRYLNQVLGPILVLVGMTLLDLLSLPSSSGGSFLARARDRVGRMGLLGALVLGALFALSFCPISAALFFGSLLPLAVMHESGLWLPSLYGVGTGLPVLGVALLVVLGARFLATAFDRLSAFEKWARRATGLSFVGIGIYLSLVHVFRVIS